jgi:VWFA-related protein
MAAMVLLMVAGIAGQEQPQPQADATPSPDAPIFRDEVDVNVVNVFVSVVDRDGSPVSGLAAADFTVAEDGAPVEITNFSELKTSGAASQSGETTSAEGEGSLPNSRVVAASLSQPRRVALLFDNTSLENRQRKRVLTSMDDWLASVTANNGRVLVACLQPELEIVQPFTSDLSVVQSALKRIADQPAQGHIVKNDRLVLVRSMQSTRTVGSDVSGFPSTSGSSGSGGGSDDSGGGNQEGSPNRGYSGVDIKATSELGADQAHQFLNQISIFRHQEYVRLGTTLSGVDRLIRGMSGLTGRKDLVWIGEDIMMRPALDVYQVYYSKFRDLSRDTLVEPPGIWSNELELTRQFGRVAESAHAADTVLHVVDASDRDREMAATDFQASDVESFFSTDTPSGMSASGGYDLSNVRDLTEGGQYLAGATGGSFLGGSKNYDPYFETLGDLVSSYYSIGYRRSGPPDGQFHRIAVKVRGDGLSVRAHERVGNPTPDQRLVDLAVSRLLIDEGPNPLGLRAEMGSAELADDGKILQEVVIIIPANTLDLAVDGDKYVGRVIVVLLATDARGNPTPPQIVQLDLTISSSHYSAATIVRSRIRLLMEPESQGLALAVRDERSGVTASAMVPADS